MYVVRINEGMDGELRSWLLKPLVPRLVEALVVPNRKACTPKICKSTVPQLANEIQVVRTGASVLGTNGFG